MEEGRGAAGEEGREEEEGRGGGRAGGRGQGRRAKEEGRGGGKGRREGGPERTRPKKTETGTRGERLSSTNMGVPGACCHPEKDGGGDKPGALILRGQDRRRRRRGQGRSAYPQPIWGCQVRGVTLKKTEAGTSPERLSSTNMGVPGAWCHPEEDGDGDKAGALTYPQGTRRKKTEAGTRPERLSSINMGCQVRGCVLPAQVHSLCFKRSRRQGRCACPRPMYRVPGLWSPPRCVASNLTKSEARTRPGDVPSTNMGYRVHRLTLVVPGASEGQVRGLNLKKTEAGTRPERLSSTNMGSQVRGRTLKKTEAGTRPERLSSTNMGCQVRGPRPGA